MGAEVKATKSGLAALAAQDRFRAVQRLAYRVAEEVAATFEPGVTERQAARSLRRRAVELGVDDWFHTPFAWFGDRTAFRGFRLPHQFMPTDRRLAEGMPYILDLAPIVDGHVADIGYAGCLGDNPIHRQLTGDLAEHRSLILRLAGERAHFDVIYREVDALISRQGYENRHRVYPGRVIGHQVGIVRGKLPPLAFGFGLRTLQTINRELIRERRAGRSTLWNDGRGSGHPPTPGIWAVEPHIGFRSSTPGAVGAKFEELLVVTEDAVYWLDDDLPHVRRWSSSPALSAVESGTN